MGQPLQMTHSLFPRQITGGRTMCAPANGADRYTNLRAATRGRPRADEASAPTQIILTGCKGGWSLHSLSLWDISP